MKERKVEGGTIINRMIAGHRIIALYSALSKQEQEKFAKVMSKKAFGKEMPIEEAMWELEVSTTAARYAIIGMALAALLPDMDVAMETKGEWKYKICPKQLATYTTPPLVQDKGRNYIQKPVALANDKVWDAFRKEAISLAIADGYFKRTNDKDIRQYDLEQDGVFRLKSNQMTFFQVAVTYFDVEERMK